MDIVGIDISVEPRGSPDKAKLDAALLHGERVRHAVFSSTEAGFGQLLAWLAKHRPDPATPLHACMEAAGNWGLELADFRMAKASGSASSISGEPLGSTRRASRPMARASSRAARPASSTQA